MITDLQPGDPLMYQYLSVNRVMNRTVTGRLGLTPIQDAIGALVKEIQPLIREYSYKAGIEHAIRHLLMDCDRVRFETRDNVLFGCIKEMSKRVGPYMSDTMDLPFISYMNVIRTIEEMDSA